MGAELQTDYGDFTADFVADCLSNLCEPDDGIQTGPFGSQLHQEDYVAVGTPIITVEHLGENRIEHSNVPCVSDEDRERLSKYQLRKGDVVFSRVGSVDRRALVREAEHGWLFSGRCLRVRPDKSKIDPEYLSYYFGLPSFKEYIRAIAVGATMPSLNTQILSDVVVAYPKDLNEQRAIAQILGTLDDKIELNRQMNETLEAMARAIFKSWFVDFGPVRAKAEGRAPGLPTHIADLFPDGFEDSELGEIPEGWEVRGLFEVTAQITKGTTPTESDISSAPASDTQINYLRVNAIADDGSILYGKLTKIPRTVHEGTLKRSILRSNDVVYTIAGTIGRVGLVEDDLLPANTNQAVAIIRPKPGLIPPGFLVLTMRQQAFQEELHSNIVHAVQANLSLGMISHANAVFPPLDSLDKIFKPIEDLLRKASANRRECRSLTALRDALLPKLICGELRVGGLKKAIPSDGHREVDCDSRRQP